MSDSDYNNNEGYLDDQTKFSEKDRVGEDEKLIPFTNGLDKGYRAKMAAWKNGKQIAIQPPYAKSDKRFTGRQTIYAGCIAHDRAGNERGVNVSKHSSLFQSGFKAGMSPIRFQKAWRTWAFQTNFMYKLVL